MSIRARGENKWLIEINKGFDMKGKRKRHTETFYGTKEEAEYKEMEIKLGMHRGTIVDIQKMTFSELVDKWLKNYAEFSLAPQALHRYKIYLDSRILPYMGKMKLEKIMPLNLIEFYNYLRSDGVREDGKKGGLADRNILHHHALISAIFEKGVKWGLMKENPAKRVDRPRVAKKEGLHYDADQTKELIKALKTEPIKYQMIIMLDISTGARRGELMGLDWDDVDFEKKTIRINKASQYITGKGIFTKETKNYTSNRVVTVSEEVMNMLKQYKKEQSEEKLSIGDLWQGSNRIFTSWYGKPMHPDTISKWFPLFLKRHNLPKLTFHGLRHTNATLLIAEGLNMKTISSRLGHSNISTTMDIYGHALKSVDQECADRLNVLFTEKK